MVVQHRKASLNLSPVPGSVTAPAARVQSTMTPEYVEAIHIMNESTMAQACDLLLSDRDYQESKQGNGGDVEPSDQDKLLELFSKCETALKVISKQQTTLSSLSVGSMPGAPALAPPLARGASAPRVAGVPKQLKQGIVPMRRTVNRTTQAATIIPGANNKPVKRPMERERSDSSLRDDAGASSQQSSSTSSQQSSANKKLKVSPTASKSVLATSKSVLAPPPGALNFLAKLNKDPNVAVTVVPKETKAPPTERRKNPGRVNRREAA
jgi:hypothetical protein